MNEKPQLITFDVDEGFPFSGEFSDVFDTRFETQIEDVKAIASQAKLILLFSECADQGLELSQQLKTELPDCPPLFLMSNIIHDTDRVLAYEAGVDDLCDYIISSDELIARCWHLIYDQIANVQLKSKVAQAKEVAHLAMANTSDLGINIQFLLDCHSCRDFNELGVRLFQALKAYGLSCSLQIRGQFELKNMEENGMSRQMESKLLKQMQHKGRYFDFGQRCIINYEQVSLLVKNMPVHNDEKCAMTKDNIFCLLQGLNAKVAALDTEFSLEQEMQAVLKLTKKLQLVIQGNEQASLNIMNESLQLVEDLAMQLEELTPFLSLNLQQETQIESMLSRAIEINQGIFSSALQKDENFTQLLANINQVLNQKVDAKVNI